MKIYAILFILLTSNVYSDMVTHDLQAYWKLDENTGTSTWDEQSHSTGTLTNGAGWDTGKCGSDVILDATNDYVRITAGTLASWFKTDMASATVECWVYITAWTTYEMFVGENYGNWIQFRVDTNGADKKLRVAVSGSSCGWVWGTNILSLNQWYQVGVTYDSSHVKFFINGAYDGNEIDCTGAIDSGFKDYPNNATLRFGDEYTDQRLIGSIDEIRIYSVALTESEINSNYNYTLNSCASGGVQWITPKQHEGIFKGISRGIGRGLK